MFYLNDGEEVRTVTAMQYKEKDALVTPHTDNRLDFFKAVHLQIVLNDPASKKTLYNFVTQESFYDLGPKTNKQIMDVDKEGVVRLYDPRKELYRTGIVQSNGNVAWQA